MEILKNQISELDQKVALLHQIVERISLQLTELITIKTETETPVLEPAVESELEASKDLVNLAPDVLPTTKEMLLNYTANNYPKHKDVIDDNNTKIYNYDESDFDLIMSPETQIRRLTAQLTAAYNRIAALEEQLLASRIQN